eukprot:GHUV01036646.1.p1 GENE.GHUV01036646.1~~GHUV01036646.1.p1  ORF type:complete len:206 (-),score=63.85 GHUV01036646.1:323-940(-)
MAGIYICLVLDLCSVWLPLHPKAYLLDDSAHAPISSILSAAIFTIAAVHQWVCQEFLPCCNSAYRLNGRFVALKIAAMHSKEAERLALEGANLKAVQSLWGQYVPALAALGPTGRRDAFVLATEYIRGRHLGSGTEEPLKQQLQAALEAVHQLEVLHGDLRSQNVVVSGEGEQQHVWLIDFGHSKQHATQVERQEEMQQLDELFA